MKESSHRNLRKKSFPEIDAQIVSILLPNTVKEYRDKNEKYKAMMNEVYLEIYRDKFPDILEKYRKSGFDISSIENMDEKEFLKRINS